MNDYSNWIKTDLHIHSIKSSNYKKNDYKGVEYTGKELIEVLTNNSVGLFSVTDHNCLNIELYKEVLEVLKDETYRGKINVLVGVELDVFDTRLHQERFHVLCIFESKDINKISIAIDELTKELPNDKYPTVKSIFETLEKKQLYRFILIPHFNNKHQGLPSSADQIENLNRLIFNAYEDANNHVKLCDSLKIYLNQGFDNFPFIAFSDNHNLAEYPGWKDKDNKTGRLSLCSILGNIYYPYNSLKTAFEEPRLRISIENVDLMRSTKINYSQVSFHNDEKIVNLSPHMNTIIGPFGSGKSLIFNKILNGINNMPPKYKELIESNRDSFLLSINGTKVASLKEAAKQNLIDKIITIGQYEELVYIDKIDSNYIKQLSEKLDFKIPKLDSFVYDYDKLLMESNVNEVLNANKNFADSYLFNFEKAFSSSQSYTVHKSENSSNKISYNDTMKLMVDSNFKHIKKLRISNIDIFNADEKKTIDNFEELLTRKRRVIQLLEKTIDELREYLNCTIDSFNGKNDFKASKSIKEKVFNIIDSYNDKIANLIQSISEYGCKYDKDKYSELLAKEDKISFDDYTITCKYNYGDKPYEDINLKMFSELYKEDDFVKSFINAIDKSETVRLKQNRPFASYLEFLDKYKQNTESTFRESNLIYDILVGEKQRSILRFSPGERSQEILKMVFKRIEDNIKNNLRTIVIIDQPENNMDNHNIMDRLH